MKLIGRIAIILFAALAVVGATMAFAQTGAAAGLAGGRPGGDRDRFIGAESGVQPGESGRRGTGAGVFPPGEGRRPMPGGAFRRGDHHGRMEGGAAGLAGLLKSLATIGLIVLGVALFERLLRRRRLARTGKTIRLAESEPADRDARDVPHG
jgi:uncharacterized membrane protein